MSKEYSILQALVAIGQAAGTGIANANHRIRELPKNNQELPADSLPCVIYTPHDGVRSVAWDTENDSNRTYVEEVCLVVGHEGDFSSNMGAVQTQHEQLLQALEKLPTGEFRTTLPGIPSVWSVEIVDAPNFDRSLLNKKYAYLSVVVKIQSIE